jgi:hypothetical protein
MADQKAQKAVDDAAIVALYNVCLIDGSAAIYSRMATAWPGVREEKDHRALTKRFQGFLSHGGRLCQEPPVRPFSQSMILLLYFRFHPFQQQRHEQQRQQQHIR